jgi:hypothetical protein
MSVPGTPHAFGYQVHGLHLTSDFPVDRISSLSRRDRPETVDAIISRGEKRDAEATEDTTRINARDGRIQIRSRFGDVIVGQREVELFPVQGTTYQSLFSYYAVYILGFLLHHRGYLTLHASAVEVDGGAVAFIGPKGMGKSTTASAFYERGHRILSDDMVACRPRLEEAPQIDPGFPWMKLKGEVLRGILGRDGGCLERSVPGSSKKILPTHGQQPSQPLPLQHIYLLGYHEEEEQDVGQDVGIEPVGSKQACLHLLSQSFVQMFLDESAADPQHLEQCAALSRHVSVSALLRPRSMDALSSVYDTVREDLGAVSPADRHTVSSQQVPKAEGQGGSCD